MSLQDRLLRASRAPVLGKLAYLALKSLGVEFPRSVQGELAPELAHGAVGLVVHSRTRLGSGVTLMPGVVLGRSDSWIPETAETATGRIMIGDRVTVGAGAKVLFKSGEELVVGAGTIVGANAVLLESTGIDEIWAGNPRAQGRFEDSVSVTILGIVTVVAILGIWFARREWTQYVVGATVAFPQTAGVIVADNGFPLFYLAVVLLAVLAAPHALLGLSRLGRAPRTRRDRMLPDLIGVALVFWAAVISIAGPRIFEGMRVFAPELGVDAQVYSMAMLHPSLGNIAQLGYVGMGVVFLLLAGRLFPVDARLIGAALWVAVVLAAVRIVAEPVWPRALLQNMPSFNYATPERLSGTFYEPSVLGLYLTAAAGYFGARLVFSRQGGRIAAVVALMLVAVDFLRNGSGTALLGLGILLALAGVVALVRVLRAGRFGVRPWAIVATVVVVGAALTQIPAILELTVGSAASKADSDSFVARTASNLRSWNIFLESAGLGIGLGGNRPSSLFLLILSCLGVIGVVLVGALVVLALRRALRYRAIEPAGWGLAGVIIAAVVAVPDLSTPAIWIGLAACLYPVISSQRAPAEFLPSTPAEVRTLDRREA